ncbi:TPA: hypothetical protein NJ528_002488 [Vibrio parahaemolyticus]|uniref:hypothetical protein n=1 Tax=Vibrio parahaemolyticus TaxID=670 RepID=UPI002362256F|nr:hypothetical protein [Vibrio parahaemolyticus]MBE4105662.1 hypothetical protein [Vibrio parahaemolyticus]HCE3717987.1 hypothetical protein [Vibrio parahaemolyticus]HCG5140283.1 hypothetical protein [Vibrio parahaemolyticus]HCG5519555.1 hypothetical protein [Vibrio parahaemolyticus]HCG6545177.1 hypothetical protein [Vibrio parahaemolyticus]
MSSPVALTNTNDLLRELFFYLGTGKALDPFTKTRFLKAASKQSSLDRMHTLEAYIHTIACDKESAKESALNGLKYVEDSATISSCLSVLQLNGYPKVAIEQAKQLQNYMDDPNFLCSFGAFFTVYPDVLLMERAMSKLEKMELHTSGDLGSLYNYFNGVSSTVESAAQNFNLEKSICSRIIEHASSVVEKAGVVLNSTEIIRQPESDWLSVVLNIETETTRQLAELNWELTGELFDAELYSPDVVARFEMVEPESIIARLRYAD